MFASIISAVGRFGGKAILLGKKYLPEILIGSGIVGFVGSVFCASKATIKAEQILDEQDEKLKKYKTMSEDPSFPEYTPDDFVSDDRNIRNKTKLKLVKAWLPTASLIVLSGVLILTGVHVFHLHSAAMATAYKAVEKAYSTYRQRVRDKYGAEEDREILEGDDTIFEQVSEKAKEDVTAVTKPVAPTCDASPYAVWFSRETSREWKQTPEENMFFLKRVERDLNDLLHFKGYLFLNEVYEALGMKFGPNNVSYKACGQFVGWVESKDGSTDNYVDFGLNDWGNKSAVSMRQCKSNRVLLDFNVDGPIYDLI